MDQRQDFKHLDEEGHVIGVLQKSETLRSNVSTWLPLLFRFLIPWTQNRYGAVLFSCHIPLSTQNYSDVNVNAGYPYTKSSSSHLLGTP